MINLDLPKTMEDYVYRIGRIRCVRASSHATSFYIDKDLFLVAQIRRAITNAKSRNKMAFAIGKVVKGKEREQALTFKKGRLALVAMTHIGATIIWVDDKYKYMITTFVDTKKGEGVADDACKY